MTSSEEFRSISRVNFEKETENAKKLKNNTKNLKTTLKTTLITLDLFIFMYGNRCSYLILFGTLFK